MPSSEYYDPPAGPSDRGRERPFGKEANLPNPVIDLVRKILRRIRRLSRLRSACLFRRSGSPSAARDRLVSEERFVPEFQSGVPWAKMHESRYLFASRLLRKSDLVLDIACGCGYGTDLLSKHAKSAIGIDKSKKAIRYARRKYAGVFICQDFFGETPMVDVVVSFETIEHIEAPIELTVRSLINRCGRLLVGSVPLNEKPGNPFHKHFQIKEEDLDFMKDYGRLKIFYQEHEPGSEIYQQEIADPQNLIFVLTIRDS